MALPKRFRHLRITHRRLEVGDRAGLGIEDRKHVGRVFRRAEELAVGVDGRIAPVRRDQVVEILLLVAPVPGRDDDVALHPLRPRRLAVRQLALGDAVGPVAEIFIGRTAEVAGQRIDHQRRGLARHGAAAPGVLARLELAERRRDRAGGQLAKLMAADAGPVLDHREPLGLGDLLGNVAFAAELAGLRDLEHRVPVDRRIVLRRRRLVRRRHRLEIELLARLAVDLRRVDETVAAHPHLVFGLGKVGHDVAALVVGHHHLGVAGRQIGGLRDHPHAGFRSARAGNRAADVVIVDGDGGLRPQLRRRGGEHPGDRRDAQIQPVLASHSCAPRAFDWWHCAWAVCARPTPARWARLCMGRCRSATMPAVEMARPAGTPLCRRRPAPSSFCALA